MEFNLLTLIGIAVAAMFFGYFFGLFEGRGQGYKRRKKEEAAAKPEVLAPPAAPPPSPPARQDNSLLRLGLDRSQQPVLELDGRAVDVPSLAPDQRKRLIDLMLIMRPWIEAAPVTKAPIPSPAAAPVAVASMAVPAPALIQTPGSSSGPRPVPEPGSPTGMVAQIDAILQARLAGTSLADRAIRLIEPDKGGVAIFVGLQRYAAVGDVPDPEVQAAIKAAIAEWEAKYTPS